MYWYTTYIRTFFTLSSDTVTHTCGVNTSPFPLFALQLHELRPTLHVPTPPPPLPVVRAALLPQLLLLTRGGPAGLPRLRA